MINYIKDWWLVLALLLVSSGLSYSFASEKEEVHGVMVVSLNAPLRATLGRTVNIEVVIGNEKATEVTTTLMVTCPATKQQIGREVKTLDGLSSHKLLFSWNTEGLKEGAYTIRAELEPVSEETDLDDNVKEAEVYLER